MMGSGFKWLHAEQKRSHECWWGTPEEKVVRSVQFHCTEQVSINLHVIFLFAFTISLEDKLNTHILQPRRLPYLPRFDLELP